MYRDVIMNIMNEAQQRPAHQRGNLYLEAIALGVLALVSKEEDNGNAKPKSGAKRKRNTSTKD